jgi:hypothetical protein
MRRFAISLSTIAVAAISMLPGNPCFAQGAHAATKVAASTPRAQVQLTPQQWFVAYDKIVSQNMITPGEKEKLEGMLTITNSTPAQKAEATALLENLVGRYNKAITLFQELPKIAQTEKLQTGYLWYFQTGAQMFKNYEQLVPNLLAMDAKTGLPLGIELLQTKQQLIDVKSGLLNIDQQLRADLGVPARTWL